VSAWVMNAGIARVDQLHRQDDKKGDKKDQIERLVLEGDAQIIERQDCDVSDHE